MHNAYYICHNVQVNVLMTYEPCTNFIFVTRIFYTAEDIAGRGLLRKERKERKNEQTVGNSVEIKSSWTKNKDDMINHLFVLMTSS